MGRHRTAHHAAPSLPKQAGSCIGIIVGGLFAMACALALGLFAALFGAAHGLVGLLLAMVFVLSLILVMREVLRIRPGSTVALPGDGHVPAEQGSGRGGADGQHDGTRHAAQRLIGQQDETGDDHQRETDRVNDAPGVIGSTVARHDPDTLPEVWPPALDVLFGDPARAQLEDPIRDWYGPDAAPGA
jgi:hypothetical protein